MKVLVVDHLRLRQRGLIFEFGVFLESVLELLVLLLVRHDKLILGHIQRLTKFYRDFLLFLENELVVLHVFFRVRFQV